VTSDEAGHTVATAGPGDRRLPAPLRDRVLRAAAAAGALWLVAYAVTTALVADDESARLQLAGLPYLVPVLAATVAAVLAAVRLRGRQTRVWHILAVSNLSWLIAEIIWVVQEQVLGIEPPFPGPADFFYLPYYLLVPVVIVLSFGSASVLRQFRALLDACLLGAAFGVLDWRLLIQPQLQEGFDLGVALGVAYPLLDLVILVLLLSLGLSGHRRVPASVHLIAAATLVAAGTDLVWTYQMLAGEYASGGWLDLGWQAQAVLLGLAAAAALRGNERRAEVIVRARDLGLLPALASTACLLVLLAIDLSRDAVEPVSAALGLFVIGGILLRLWLTARDKEQVVQALDLALKEQERLAVTDGLTGLYNRRFFEEVLRLETDRALRSGQPVSVLVMDLDHFKRVNDSHGHEAGDAVLREVARRLSRAARPSDIVARYGGEEFVVLLPGTETEALREVAERVRVAVAGEPVELPGPARLRLQVTASLGGATHPTHAARVDELIRTADRALYAAKGRGRNRVCIGADGDDDGPAATALDTAVLPLLHRLADLVDARQGPDEHGAAVARWAGVVADGLGLDRARRERVQLAARLHDIGKLAVPDAVLHKPGPLTDAEWAAITRHAVAGAHLLEAVPGLEDVAALVRAHHERPDGFGYPDGLGGGQLPLEAGVIAVCDAWAAMRSRRANAPMRSRAEARQELVRGRGTQFDPVVVDLFLALEAAGVVGSLESLPAAASATAIRLS
jgi:diguanylate cyclase (GGDEF)-like protein